jgi:hypothetical protein
MNVNRQNSSLNGTGVVNLNATNASKSGSTPVIAEAGDVPLSLPFNPFEFLWTG